MTARGLLVSLLLGVGATMVPATTIHAEDAKFELQASATMKEVLADRVGKRTVLRFRSGEDIDGTVTMVGNGLVHVTRLAGKDFYDAVVDIGTISAVIFQARGR
jgi:hypothetical protein